MEINNPNQPINQSEAPVQPVSKPVNKKGGLFPIILGVLLLLVLIGGGAYCLGTQNGISGTIISHADEGYFDNIQVSIGRRTGFGTTDSVGI